MIFDNNLTTVVTRMANSPHPFAPPAPSLDMNLVRLFVEHPATVGETYTEHLRVATGFGIAMIGGGLACLVHAVLPFTFVTRGSETIARLHERMVISRTKRGGAPATRPADGGAR